MAERVNKKEYIVTVNFVDIQTKQEQERRQHAANAIQDVLIRYLTENPPKEEKGKVDRVG